MAIALWAVPASAQIFETVGTRAQGMGGAFVALADDATASWWNPAGLAAGQIFSGILENTRADADEMRARGFALSFPSLALSYYRLPINGIRPVNSTTELIPPGRQDLGSLSVFGATVGQSIGDHLVVASTFKILRGNGDTHSDLDIGAIVRVGHARLGAVVKNLRKPTFGSDLDAVELRRQVRVGAALTSDTGGPSNLSITVDGDLTTVGTIAGDERHLAVGAEAWAPSRRVAIRGGVAINTVGETRRSQSAGISLWLRKGVYIDGQITGGLDEARTGWGTGLRLSF